MILRPLFLPCVLALATLTGASGCVVPRAVARAATEGFVEQPGVEIVDVSVTRRTAQGVAFAVTVEFENPNAVELPLGEVMLALQVDGLGGFEASSPPRVSLPPAGVIRTTLRASLPAPTPSDASLEGRRYRCTVSTGYVPPGEIREIGTESGFPLPVARVAIRGTLGKAAGKGAPSAAAG